MSKSTENKALALAVRVKAVRRWLVWLAVLKVTALCLVFVSVYIGFYAWLDHKLHFGGTARITALGLLITGIILLLIRLCKLLISHISLSRAANYIEGKNSFDQQLVAAIEYYEDNTDYPYSKELANELVNRVDVAAAETDFRATISSRLMYVLVSVILCGAGMVCYYMLDNYAYFSRYFTRLTHPLAKIEPIPPTYLEPITREIMTEPGSLAILSARIDGRLPEYGNLILADVNETGDTQNDQVFETLQLRPVTHEDEPPRLEARIPFEETGKFRYRFEADQAVTPWQDIIVCTTPAIKQIVANVTLNDTRYVKPYQQHIEDFSLEVLDDSRVMLEVLATENLQKVVINGLHGQTFTKELKNADTFTFTFDVKQDGFIEFVLTSAKDVTNSNIQPLQVKVKPDTPANFKLLSPGGDYLATNVASVPISFEITDDFGLKSASLSLEIAGGEPEIFNAQIQEGDKSKKITRILELEEYDLEVGDSIVFYANATDVSPTGDLNRPMAASDIYFIEIKPYRQRWHDVEPGLPDQPKQGLEPDKVMLHDKLIDVLEYTRAFVKKTWKIAAKSELDDLDRSRLESINKDVEYAGEQLTLIRDDIRYGFGPTEKATLNEVLASYHQASTHLILHNAKTAIVPEKQAYQTLRKFIIELEKILCPPGTGSPPPPKLDKVKMEDLVHLTRFEKERIEWELNRLAQKLEQIAREQEELRETFEKFLEAQKRAKRFYQETTDEKTWIAKNEKALGEGQPCPNCGSTEPGSCPECQSPTVEGALIPPPASKPASAQQAGRGHGSGAGTGSGSGTGAGSKATMAEKMEMLQAKQKAMKAQIQSLEEELKKVTSKENSASNQKIQKNLENAVKKMEEFDAKLTEAPYRPKQEQMKLAEALEALKQAEEKISEALMELQKASNLSEDQILANEAAKLAREMTRISETMERGVNPYSKEELLQMLNESESVFETAGKLQTGNAAGSTAFGKSFFREMKKVISVKVENSDLLAGYFNTLARELWSVALANKKLDSGLTEETPSDARFYELENKFFEHAAEFE